MRLIRLALSFMLLCAVWTSGWAQTSQQLEVSGAVKQVIKLDAAALAAFPAADTGRIALICSTDQRLGPRHVRNLARIEVRALD